MPDFAELVPHVGANIWLYMPVAVLLGALHGLEPGHSKTMMAAFIVAVRGTVGQAVLLGLSAALSHTAIVWIIALGGQYFSSGFNAATSEPYFQLASAAMILAVTAWMMWRTWREHHGRDSGPLHHHPAGAHDHGSETRVIDTGHGTMALEVFEDGVPPRWRIRFKSGQAWPAADVAVTTARPDGTRQTYAFAQRDAYLESLEGIPEPHEFTARVSLGHGGHSHDYELAFAEHHHEHSGHGHHEHAHGDQDSRDERQHGNHPVNLEADSMDAHERAHARDIARRFSGGKASTGQIVMFGLTGGLVPCPAAITVLLLCLQLKRFILAVVLVFCFSIGVAATMVAAGVIAAVGMRQIRKHWSGFDAVAARAPYASGALMMVIALYMAISAWVTLHGGTVPV